MPIGPCTLIVHIASVWVPFTSESKEAIAHYPEIIKEIKLALQECGRKLGSYISKKRRVGSELEKRSFIEKYIPHVGESLKDLLDLSDKDEKKIEEMLKEILEHHRGKVESMEFDESKNVDFDESFAALGSDENALEEDIEDKEDKKDDNNNAKSKEESKEKDESNDNKKETQTKLE